MGAWPGLDLGLQDTAVGMLGPDAAVLLAKDLDSRLMLHSHAVALATASMWHTAGCCTPSFCPHLIVIGRIRSELV